MRRYAQTALLFLLGGMLLKLALTGAYARYVRAIHLPFLIVAGLALIAVAGFTLWRDVRDLRTPNEDELTLPMRLGGLFRSDVLSAPDQPRTTTTTLTPVGVAGAIAAADRLDSTLDPRDRGLAAALAVAEHEGLHEGSPAEGNAAEPTTGQPAAGAIAGDTVLIPAMTDETAVIPHATLAATAGGGAATAVIPAQSRPTTITSSIPAVDPFGPQPPAPVPASTGTRGGWALLVLSLAVLLVAPPALGVELATRSGTELVDAAPAAAPEGDPVTMRLADYAAHAVAGGQAVEGRRIRLVGFVVAGPHGEPYLARLRVGCCAAGARPVKVGLTGDLPGVLTPGAWVAVVGTYAERVDPDPVNGAPIPYLSVVEVTTVGEPADPYES